MKVSVVIPSYNHKKYVKTAIESVINQSYENKELLVIDDGSSDGSAEYLQDLSKELNFKLILKENEGVCETLNIGIKHTDGEILMFLASDDFFVDSSIEERVKEFNKYPDADILTGAVNVVDKNGVVLRTRTSSRLGSVSFNDLLIRNFILAPTATFKRSTFSKYGVYDKSYKIEDLYMWLKTLKQGAKIIVTDSIWVNYRIDEDIFSSRFRTYFDGQLKVLNDYKELPEVVDSISRIERLYLIKVSLSRGELIYNEDIDVLNKADFKLRLALNLITCLPKFIRFSVLKYLIFRG